MSLLFSFFRIITFLIRCFFKFFFNIVIFLIFSLCFCFYFILLESESIGERLFQLVDVLMSGSPQKLLNAIIFFFILFFTDLIMRGFNFIVFKTITINLLMDFLERVRIVIFITFIHSRWLLLLCSTPALSLLSRYWIICFLRL